MNFSSDHPFAKMDIPKGLQCLSNEPLLIIELHIEGGSEAGVFGYSAAVTSSTGGLGMKLLRMRERERGKMLVLGWIMVLLFQWVMFWRLEILASTSITSKSTDMYVVPRD